jgi:hypothetical protein
LTSGRSKKGPQCHARLRAPSIAACSIDAELFADQITEFISQLFVSWYCGLPVVPGICVDVVLASVPLQFATLPLDVPYEVSMLQREIPTILDLYVPTAIVAWSSSATSL